MVLRKTKIIMNQALMTSWRKGMYQSSSKRNSSKEDRTKQIALRHPKPKWRSKGRKIMRRRNKSFKTSWVESRLTIAKYSVMTWTFRKFSRHSTPKQRQLTLKNKAAVWPTVPCHLFQDLARDWRKEGKPQERRKKHRNKKRQEKRKSSQRLLRGKKLKRKRLMHQVIKLLQKLLMLKQMLQVKKLSTRRKSKLKKRLLRLNPRRRLNQLQLQSRPYMIVQMTESTRNLRLIHHWHPNMRPLKKYGQKPSQMLRVTSRGGMNKERNLPSKLGRSKNNMRRWLQKRLKKWKRTFPSGSAMPLQPPNPKLKKRKKACLANSKIE